MTTLAFTSMKIRVNIRKNMKLIKTFKDTKIKMPKAT